MPKLAGQLGLVLLVYATFRAAEQLHTSSRVMLDTLPFASDGGYVSINTAADECMNWGFIVACKAFTTGQYPTVSRVYVSICILSSVTKCAKRKSGERTYVRENCRLSSSLVSPLKVKVKNAI